MYLSVSLTLFTLISITHASSQTFMEYQRGYKKKCHINTGNPKIMSNNNSGTTSNSVLTIDLRFAQNL